MKVEELLLNLLFVPEVFLYSGESDSIGVCIKNVLLDLSVKKIRISSVGVWWNILDGKGILSKHVSQGMWNHFSICH